MASDLVISLPRASWFTPDPEIHTRRGSTSFISITGTLRSDWASPLRSGGQVEVDSWTDLAGIAERLSTRGDSGHGQRWRVARDCLPGQRDAGGRLRCRRDSFIVFELQ